MYYSIRNMTTFSTLAFIIILLLAILGLNSINIPGWFLTLLLPAFLGIMWYFKYTNLYSIPYYGIITYFITPIIVVTCIACTTASFAAINLITDERSFYYSLCFVVLTYILLFILWMRFDYKRWWSQVPPAWLKQNAKIDHNRLFIHHNINGAALGGWTGAIAAVFGIATKGLVDTPIGAYLFFTLALIVTLAISWAFSKVLNMYFQFRKIEKQRGERFIFWNLEEIQQERSKSWLGRLINPKLRPIYAELKLAAAQPVPVLAKLHSGKNKKPHKK